MDFSIIKTGGKQYIVSKGKELEIEKLEANNGDKIELDTIFSFKAGKINLKPAKVKGEIIDMIKGKKVTINKFKAKSRYRKRQGHRQNYTLIKITSI